MAGQTIQVSVLADTRRFSQAMQGLSRSTGLSRLGSSFASAGKKVVGFLGGATKATAAFGVALAGYSLKKGFDRLNALDQAKSKLSGLGNSAKQVDSIMKNALTSVQGTAFGMDEAATTAAGAVAAGIKPGKDLTRTLSLTADAATIAGTSMGDMGSIFNKVATSNKIQGDVIAQLSDKGIPIVSLLSKELGKSSEETVKLASAGKINFATFQKAMEKGVGGAAKKSGDTVQGAFANIKASLGRIGAGALSGIFSKIAPLLKNITTNLGPLEEKASKVGDALGGWVANSVVPWISGTLVPAIKSVWTWVSTKLWPAIKEVGAQLGGAFAQAWSTISKSFSDAGASASGLASGLGDKVVGAVRTLGPILAGVITTLASMVAFLIRNKDIVLSLGVAIGTAVAAFKAYKAVMEIARAAQLLFNIAAAANPLGILVVALAAVTAGLVYFFTQTETGRQVWNRLKAAVSAVVDWFKGTFIPFFTTTLPGVFQGLLDWVRSHWKLILGILTGPIGTAVILITSHWGKIKGAFSAAWGWVSTAFKGAWNGIKTILSLPISGARTLIGAYVGGIKRVFSVAWSWVSGTFRASWSGLRLVLTSPITAGKRVISTLFGDIKNIFRRTRDALGTIWSGLKSKITSPISSVVSWIGGHFVDPVNSLLSKVGVGFRVPWPKYAGGGTVGHGGGHVPVAQFASGGILPGYSPGRDNMHWFSPKFGGLSLSGGEGILRPEAVRALGLSRFNALNSAARAGGVSAVRKMLGFATGGIIPHRAYGLGGIIGDIGGGIWSGIKTIGGVAVDFAKFIANPARILSKYLNGISSNLWGKAAKGALTKAISGIANKVTGGLVGGSGGTPGNSGGKGGRGWQWQWNLIHSLFPGVSLTSAYRPGAHTAGSGALSYHALGRAIDLGGSVAQLTKVAKWILGNFGASTHDLLYSPLWGRMGLYEGKWYPQPAVTVAQHGNHVHWGYATGTSNAGGGWSWVGERGAELMKVPPGAQILSAKDSQQKTQREGVGGLSAEDRALLREAITELRRQPQLVAAGARAGIEGKSRRDAQSNHLLRGRGGR